MCLNLLSGGGREGGKELWGQQTTGEGSTGIFLGRNVITHPEKLCQVHTQDLSLLTSVLRTENLAHTNVNREGKGSLERSEECDNTHKILRKLRETI